MTRHTHSIRAAAFALFMGANAATAQTNGTFLLTSSNTVSPSSPSTTIEIWATWDDPLKDHLFAAADYDLIAKDGVFSNPVNILMGPGSSAGVANGNTVRGGVNGQLYIPGIGWPHVFGEPTLLASYTWTATDFTPRTVNLVTENTSHFLLSVRNSSIPIELYPHEFSPGFGVINVVPGSGVWIVLGLPLLARRRRAHV